MGKERGDLDLHFHQSIPPLSEGNPLDLDLGDSFVEFFLVLPLLFPHKHLLLCWNLRVKDLSTCALAICIGLLSPRGFVEVKVCGLVTLGSWTLDGVVVFLGASN